MAHLVTVTGATGHNGAAICARLLDRGVRVRAVARGAKALQRLASLGAETRAGDLGDARLLTDAFRGADAVFTMIPQDLGAADYPADQRRLIDGVMAALESAEVPRIVALTTPSARLRIGLPALLGDFQDRLQALSGRAVMVLQPTYYMENFLTSIPTIRSAGIVGGAIRGDVALPMIATRDVAEIAAGYLREASFDGYAERPLLGPGDLTFEEASSIIGAAIGRPDLAYVQFSEERVRPGLLGAGWSPSAADAYLEMTRAINGRGKRSGAPRDAPSVTPTTLEDFAREVFAPAFEWAAV